MGNPWRIVATTNSAGAISYVGHNDFVISYTMISTIPEIIPQLQLIITTLVELLQ